MKKRDDGCYCFYLWESPQINWDGKIFGCCCNSGGIFGKDAFDKSMDEIMNLPKLVYARKMLMGRAPERLDIPCIKCIFYRRMKAEKDWIEED